MGVHGLWKLIESSGKPIPLETLENKVLAVDVSIWLHQAIKGFQDSKGASVANAHLLGIYHRVCKLLYFKIKPIFVFDGEVPALKRQTIAKRNQLKSRNASQADKLQKQLISTLLKHTAISKVLSEKAKASLPILKKSSTKHEELYALPLSSDVNLDLSSSSSDDPESDDEKCSNNINRKWDLHTIDTTSHYFKTLPLEVKHEILTELKETRKQNSWGKLHELPKQSDDFSGYQMKRLLKRQQVQSALEEVSKEMGGNSLSLSELESLLKDKGVPTTSTTIGKRIASDDTTRYLYINNIQEEIKLKKADEELKKLKNITEEEEELEKAIQLSLKNDVDDDKDNKKLVGDLEEEQAFKRAIKLSLKNDDDDGDNDNKKHVGDLEEEQAFKRAIKLSRKNDIDDDNDNKKHVGDLEEEQAFKRAIELSLQDNDNITANSDSEKQTRNLTTKLKSAQNYMLEYSGLTPNEIAKILNKNGTEEIKSNKSISNINLIESNKKERLGEININPEIYENNDLFIINDTTINCKKNNNHKIIDEKMPNKSSEVIVDPNKPKSDHRFNKAVIVSENDKTFTNEKNNEKIAKSSLEVIVDPNKPENDHICNKDVIISENENTSFTNVKNNEKVPKSPLEIIIDPNKIETDDIFKDVFAVDNRIPNINNNSKLNFAKLHIKSINNEDENEIEIMSDSDESDLEITETNSNLETTSSDKNDIIHTSFKEITKDIPDSSNKDLKENSLNYILNNNKIEKNSTKDDKLSEPQISMKEMKELQENLETEQTELLKEKSNKERLASNITAQMYEEAQELLELFGIPYIVAPMEAEAQCAFLDEINLTDGTITDDSDIWLFGGKTVYKNFFNQSKYVMEFKSENIEHYFKLNREQMILLALLVGSDYTFGLPGIGPVTALEILAYFPVVNKFEITSGLKEFKSCFIKGKTPLPGTLKNKLKNLNFTEAFPNINIVNAYLEPKVDTSKTPLSWSKPDITGLKIFAKDKFGWTIKKTEEILNPVIKKLQESNSQPSIKDYFKITFKNSGNLDEEKISNRVKNAVSKMGKTREEILNEEKEKHKENKNLLQRKSRKNTKTVTESSTKPTNENHENNVRHDKELKKTSKSKSTKKSMKIDKNTEEISKNIDDKELKKTSQSKSTKKIMEVDKNTEEISKNIDDKELKKTSRSKSTKKTMEIDKNTEEISKNIDDIKDYENLAKELKTRRKRKIELSKIKNEAKKLKITPEKDENNEEIQLLKATTSKSIIRVKEIKNDTIKMLEKQKKVELPSSFLHTNEVIHQRQRDKSNLLRNKLKAIEVYRKSKKGPGYVQKRGKKKMVPKEDAELSEDSD